MYKSAGIVIIGDEILSGKFAEENARFLIEEFRELGVSLRRVAVIPDDIEDIADTVQRFSTRFDVVVTSGGVGPTHDDMTMAGIAKAFATRVVVHPTLEAILRAHWGPSMPAANIRLAEIPEGAELVGGGSASAWPTVRMRNVYIMPGVPAHFQAKFQAIRELFRCPPTLVVRVYVDQDEGLLAPVLAQLSADFPAVKIGSYPRFGEIGYRVIVTLEGKERAPLDEASARLEDTLAGSVVRVELPEHTTE